MIIKQTSGSLLYLAGPLSEIEPINFSCYNFCNDCDSELQSMGGDFYYFLISESNYIHARSQNMRINWKYLSQDGTNLQKYKRTKMAYKLALLKAKAELAAYPEQHFISNGQKFVANIHSFGNIPKDLSELNSSVAEFEIEQDKKMVKENELIIEQLPED